MNRQMTFSTYVFLFCLLLSPFYSWGQGWEKTIGETDRDFGIAIAPATDGNYVIGGISFDGLGTDPERDLFLTKIDLNGNILWTQLHGPTDGREFLNDLIATSDGGFLLAGSASPGGGSLKSYLIKTDSSGQEEWSRTYETAGVPGEIEQVIEANGGGYIFVGNEEHRGDEDIAIGRVDANGNLIWMQAYDESQSDKGFAVVETPQNEIIVSGFTDGGGGDNDFLLMKVDNNGNKIWTTASDTIRIARFVHLHSNGDLTTIGDLSNAGNTAITRLDENGSVLWSRNITLSFFSSMRRAIVTSDGGFAITGQGFTNPPGSVANMYLQKIDNQGNLEWVQYFGGGLTTLGNHVVQTPDEGYLGIGHQYSELNVTQEDAYVVKVDSLGRLYSNIINGRIAHDTSMDCLVDSSETGLVSWVVEAVNTDGRRFFGSSDSTGYYEVNADTGSYEIILYPRNLYWSACVNNVPLTLTNFYDTTLVDFALQADIECPLMHVDIATPFLRRCFDNIYTVNYCNEGTLPGDSAYVDITLDPFMTFVNSSIPAQMVGPDLYRFQLGDIAVGQCGRFNFTINLDCDSTVLGQTHCVEAHIFPDSLCLPISSNWSGAFIEVDAACQDTSLNFTIENSGLGSMNGPLRYVIIEDAILLMTAPFQLDAAETVHIPLPKNGSTYLLYAEQEPGAPGNARPILSVEGCVVTPGTPFSTGFINQFPQNDLDPFIEIDCRQNRGSYDPNDKQAFPIGYGPEHFIEANTELEYLIRFQNTGTDTAFKVVIQDTLSQWLNPASIQPGTSSHPYTFLLSKDGIAEFTFDNIMLPDSNVNFAASNGFVKFRIAQRLDNPIGTRIENQAAIFFDFNPPIITNQAFHTIGEDLIEIILDTEEPFNHANALIKVYPNPLQETATFELVTSDYSNSQFELFDSAGQLVRLATINGPRYQFERQALPAGFYFFSVQQGGKVIGTGKIIIR